jgi:hypothetical protein
MTRLRKLAGTIVLLGVGGLYAVIALARGHSAASEPPADLSAREAALDVWRGLALLAEQDAQLLDLRPRERFELYHLPRAESMPGASAATIAERARGGRPVLLLAEKDEVAAALAGAARKLSPKARVHFLQDGARSLYLALELPVPLFSDAPPPFGYARALATVRGWAQQPASAERRAVIEAIGLLSRASYAPTALQAKRKAPAGGAKKKISGGCG